MGYDSPSVEKPVRKPRRSSIFNNNIKVDNSKYPIEYLQKVDNEIAQWFEKYKICVEQVTQMKEQLEVNEPLKLDLSMLSQKNQDFLRKKQNPIHFVNLASDYVAKIEINAECLKMRQISIKKLKEL